MRIQDSHIFSTKNNSVFVILMFYSGSRIGLFISLKKPRWRNVGLNKSGHLFVLVLCINELLILMFEILMNR